MGVRPSKQWGVRLKARGRPDMREIFKLDPVMYTHTLFVIVPDTRLLRCDLLGT